MFGFDLVRYMYLQTHTYLYLQSRLLNHTRTTINYLFYLICLYWLYFLNPYYLTPSNSLRSIIASGKSIVSSLLHSHWRPTLHFQENVSYEAVWPAYCLQGRTLQAGNVPLSILVLLNTSSFLVYLFLYQDV